MNEVPTRDGTAPPMGSTPAENAAARLFQSTQVVYVSRFGRTPKHPISKVTRTVSTPLRGGLNSTIRSMDASGRGSEDSTKASGSARRD